MEEAGRKTILIVDDALTNRIVLKKIFSPDYRVEEAANGAEALEIMRRQPEIAAVVLDLFMPELDGFGVLARMRSDDRISGIPVVVVTASEDLQTQLRALDSGATDVLTKPYNARIVLHRVRNLIARRELEALAAQRRLYEELLYQTEHDQLTGLYSRQGFYRHARALLDACPQTGFLLVRMDIDRFKAINDTSGTEAGDRLLAEIGRALRSHPQKDTVFGRLDADHFVALIPKDALEPRHLDDLFSSRRLSSPSDFHLSASIGVYEVTDRSVEVSLMCDRALLALRTVKNSYTDKVAYYSDDLRRQLLDEQTLTSEMDAALEAGQFVVYFQPQVDYTAGTLIGAEALVRWRHPKRGLLTPDHFIPLFEKNGFISRLDEFVWEESCRQMREWLDREGKLLPVSVAVNISRMDIRDPQLGGKLKALVDKYRLPVSSLRLEITEGIYMENSAQLIDAVRRMQAQGFTVEMDDFGSGYSSLNMLKDVPVDLLKLDMRFLSGGADPSRSGNILSSVIRMAHWLKLPVIAEGVETRAQADYLKSLGGCYMQGYLFGRPMPAAEFEPLLKSRSISATNCYRDTSLSGMAAFWDASEQEALLFGSLVGGAAIMEYYGGNLEAVRLNDAYYAAIGADPGVYTQAQLHVLEQVCPEDRPLCRRKLDQAIATGEEISAEIRCLPLRSGGEPFWLHVRSRLLAKSADRCLFYMSVENITQRRRLEEHNARLSAQLSAVMENVPGGIMDFKITDHVETLFFNDGMAAMCGFSREEFQRRFAADSVSAVHPGDQGALRRAIAEVVGGEKALLHLRYRQLCRDGGWRWVEIYGRVQRREDHAVYSSAIILDVDEQARQEEKSRWQVERYRILSQSEGAITFDYAPDSDTMFVSLTQPGRGLTEKTIPRYLRELDGNDWLEDSGRADYRKGLERACRTPGPGALDYRADYFGTGFHWYRTKYTSVPDAGGRVVRIVGRVDDIDELVGQRDSFRSRSMTDGMTGLLNKENARASVEQLLVQKPPERLDVLLFLDVDNFKAINDTFGHLEGDRVLKLVGRTLSGLFRSDDLVARFGGDEFLVYLRSIGSPAQARQKAAEVLRAVAAIPCERVGALHCSIGVALVSGTLVDFDTLFQRADYAMYLSKKSRKNCYTVYDPATMGTSIQDIGAHEREAR